MLRVGVSVIPLAVVLTGCVAGMGTTGDDLPPGPSAAGPAGGVSTADAFVATVSAGAEPSILADRGGRFLWIADTGGVYRSRDDGATWEALLVPFVLRCDGVALAQDEAGALYAVSTACPLIQTARSTDGGDLWDRVQPVADAAPIADRPWIAAGAPDRVVVVFADVFRTTTETCLSSTDGGLTFPDRWMFTPAHAGGLVLDAEGAIYYSQGGTTNSATPGATLWRRDGTCLAPPEHLTVFDAIGKQVFTQLATDGSAVYVAAPTPDNGAVQVGGTADFDAVKAHVIDPPGDGAVTFTTISATPDEVAVGWYGTDTAGDPTDPSFEGTWHVFVARIRGFWSAAPEVDIAQVGTAPNHIGSLCMSGLNCGSGVDRDLLDYFMIDHGPDGTLHVAFGDDAGQATPVVRYARLPAG